MMKCWATSKLGIQEIHQWFVRACLKQGLFCVSLNYIPWDVLTNQPTNNMSQTSWAEHGHTWNFLWAFLKFPHHKSKLTKWLMRYSYFKETRKTQKCVRATLAFPPFNIWICWSEWSSCAGCGSWQKQRWPLFMVKKSFFFVFLFFFYRYCHRSTKFCMGFSVTKIGGLQSITKNWDTPPLCPPGAIF